MVVKKRLKNAENFICEECNFICSKQCDFNRHLSTRKHQMVVNGSKMVGEKTPKTYVCICGNVYKHDSGYYRHKKVCLAAENKKSNVLTPTDDIITGDTDKELLIYLLKENREIKESMLEQQKTIVELCKNGINNGTINNHTNNGTINNNNNFNLNFFLNETCKDAMNITDFVNSLKITLQDFEKVGELGYTEGISQMFLKGLNELDVTKRPIHCSDLKREVLHIKEHDKWEKDTDKSRLRKAIKDISNKNMMLMDNWQREHPGCKEYNNSKNDLYLKMMIESIGPVESKHQTKEHGKIIRRIAQSTIIDKSIV